MEHLLLNGGGTYGLMGGGIYHLMGGAFMVGQLWQSKLFNLET